jgi:hypothetical protein
MSELKVSELDAVAMALIENHYGKKQWIVYTRDFQKLYINVGENQMQALEREIATDIQLPA